MEHMFSEMPSILVNLIRTLPSFFLGKLINNSVTYVPKCSNQLVQLAGSQHTSTIRELNNLFITQYTRLFNLPLERSELKNPIHVHACVCVCQFGRDYLIKLITPINFFFLVREECSSSSSMLTQHVKVITGGTTEKKKKRELNQPLPFTHRTCSQ